MDLHVEMQGIIIEQLRASSVQGLIGLLICVSQDPREEGQRVRLDGFKEGEFPDLAYFLEASVFRPCTDGTLYSLASLHQGS